MRYISKIELTGLAFHYIDGKQQRIVLSQELVELNDRKKFLEYISNHIINSLSDPAAKAASFVKNSQNLGDKVQKILSNSIELLNGSQDIARRLFEILKKDKRISPGVLVVCMFREHDILKNDETNNDENETTDRAETKICSNNYLGILKLDPTSGFQQQILKKKGVTTVDVEIVQDILPSVKQSLQKCAFIRQHNPQSEYDLLVLDKQTSGTKDISDFFSNKFLGIEEAFDSKRCTSDFYSGLIEVERELAPLLDKKGRSSIENAKKAALTSKEINVNSFLGNLSISPEHIDTAKKIMVNFVHNNSFEVDQNFVTKFRKTKKYQGDYGMEFKFTARHESKINLKVTYEKDSPYATISFRAKNWAEKGK